MLRRSLLSSRCFVMSPTPGHFPVWPKSSFPPNPSSEPSLSRYPLIWCPWITSLVSWFVAVVVILFYFCSFFPLWSFCLGRRFCRLFFWLGGSDRFFRLSCLFCFLLSLFLFKPPCLSDLSLRCFFSALFLLPLRDGFFFNIMNPSLVASVLKIPYIGIPLVPLYSFPFSIFCTLPPRSRSLMLTLHVT